MTNINNVPIVSPLVDGEPLTYDKINEIISALTKLRNNVNGLTNPNSGSSRFPKIDVIGSNADRQKFINNADIVSVQIGSQLFRNFQNQTNREVISFDKSFSQPPIVVAMLRKSDNDAKQDAIPYAVVSLISVGKEKFEVEIKTIQTNQDLKNIRIDYIAVGPTA
jgi:hypothetical protein